MPTINGKRVLNSVVPKNNMGGLDKVSNKEQAISGGKVGDLNIVQPTVSAQDLVNPVPQVNPPAPVTPTPSNRTSSVVGNVLRDTQGFITNQSAEAQKARELANTLGAFGGQSGAGDLRNTLNNQYQIPENLKTLQDIQLQLESNQTSTELQKSQIGNAPGQTVGQAQREVTQADREGAIRDAGLAARAAVLQGNIETASTLVSQAVQDFNADRTAKNQNILQQLDYYQSISSEQTGQLIEQEKRKYEAEQATIERVQGAVDAAMASGAATEQDIAQLTNPKLTDEQRLAVAQGISARAASEMRNLDVQAKQANIAQSYASTRASNLSSLKSQAELDAINNTNSGTSNSAVQAFDVFAGSLSQNNREQYTNAITGAVKRSNIEQTEIALKNAAQAAAGKALTEDVVKRDQAIGALKDVRKALDEYTKAGGNTNLLVGGYEDLQNKLGKTSNPKLAEIETRINLALNAYTNAVSGASFTPQESERYKALFPSTSKNPELNTAKIDTLLSTFESNNQVFYGNFYGGSTPSQLAEQAVYEELIATASPEQLAELGITK